MADFKILTLKDMTLQDIIIINQILERVEEKFKVDGKYMPAPLENAIKHFQNTFSKELSWSKDIE